MCLTLRHALGDVPYNKTKFRWKFMVYNKKTNKLTAPYVGGRYAYPEKKWMRATHNSTFDFKPDLHDVGFHVFVTKRDAQARLNKSRFSDYGGILVKVEVDEFIASGTFGGRRSETWKKMRVVECLYK
jgi:hypothetical protein